MLNHRHNTEELLPLCFFTTDDCYRDEVVLEAASDASLTAAIRNLYQRNDQLLATELQIQEQYPHLVSEKDHARSIMRSQLCRPNNALDLSDTDMLHNFLQA